MSKFKFSDLPADDPLRLKVEQRVLEVQQIEIYRCTVALFEAQKMWDWWTKHPTAKFGIRQKEFVERVLWNRVERSTTTLNDILDKVYGKPIEDGTP